MREIFEKAEIDDAMDSLLSIFKIIRSIVNLADYELLDLLVSNDYYLFVFGALECIPYIFYLIII